jgi:hypothetical protein
MFIFYKIFFYFYKSIYLKSFYLVNLYRNYKNNNFFIFKNFIIKYKYIIYIFTIKFLNNFYNKINFEKNWRINCISYSNSLNQVKLFDTFKNILFENVQVYNYFNKILYLPIDILKLITLVKIKLKSNKFNNLTRHYLNLIYKTKVFLRNYSLLRQSNYNSFYYYYTKLNFDYLIFRRKNKMDEISEIKVEIEKYFIKLKFTKNNFFILLYNQNGAVKVFLSAGRLIRGKRKTTYLTIRNTTKIFIKLVFRFFKFYQINYFKQLHNKDKKLKILIFLILNKTYHHFLVKTSLNSFKFFHFPIFNFFYFIKIPHSLGSKKRKMRRV